MSTDPEKRAAPKRSRAPHHLLAYLLSVPERIVRVIVSFLGGTALVLTFLLPRPLREGKFFKLVVERQIKMLTDDVGQAKLFRDAEALDARSAARMGIGGTVDNLLILTLHASPVWVLLAASDVCEGARSFTEELGRELQDQGVIDKNSRLSSVDDVLGGLAKLSSRMAHTIDMPPISLDEMKSTVDGLKTEINEVTDTAAQAAQLDDLVDDLRAVAETEDRSLLSVCAAVASGTMRTTGNLISGTVHGATAAVRIVGRRVWSDVVMDYANAASRVRKTGFYGSVRKFLRPQVRGYRRLFNYRFVTYTEIALSLGAWRNAAWRRR